MIAPWMSSTSGRTIDLMHPEKSEIVLQDICATLPNVCRFGGRVNRFYSVAEHSLLVAELLRDAGFDAHTILGGLLHDAHEAITGDMPSPTKRVLGETWRVFEKDWEHHVRESFGVLYIWEDPIRAKAIAAADLEALATEKAAGICPPGELGWGEAVNSIEPKDWAIQAIKEEQNTCRATWGRRLEKAVLRYLDEAAGEILRDRRSKAC